MIVQIRGKHVLGNNNFWTDGNFFRRGSRRNSVRHSRSQKLGAANLLIVYKQISDTQRKKKTFRIHSDIDLVDSAER